MDITGNTKITGLFGYPVEHTLSPAMHNAAFDHLGMNCRYLPFVVHPGLLGAAVGSITALNLVGVNVTVPHKESVIPFLDEVDEEAAFIGAVNTIVRRESKLHGFNTDGRGFMRSLSEHNIRVEGTKILVIGAGGASRAISYYLSEKSRALFLYDVAIEKRDALVSDLSRIRKNVSALGRLENLESFELIINATPLGLKRDDPVPLDTSRLSTDQVVCDLIYRQTRLLQEASQRGCRTLDGLGMLLWQGVLAFELWTGVMPPVEIMQNALLQSIER
jgi:shikimate dehydrogenase